ncbi:SCP2 sterol-binding domain-containing protein [Natronomonas amylolytica]|uniref:SCP2 sterol-binding domain-containing protein n=1 Tax=Natronomonas amylolytica TaxID=3108498 RepID=UPI0030082F7A
MTEATTYAEDLLDASTDDLADELSGFLADVDGETEAFVRANPELFGAVVGRMEEIDIAAFVDANPETADGFQDFLWTGTQVLVENDESVREQITQDITVNFEADDCAMAGHLEVDAASETLTGGAGILEDPILEIEGPADNLVGLITGDIDPVQGFMSQQYELDGPVHVGTQLAPIMGALSEHYE